MSKQARPGLACTTYVYFHALYNVSKKMLATSSTSVGPTALELPRPDTSNQVSHRMNAVNLNPQNNAPYNATIVPLPSGVSFASLTDALRSAMSVSTTCNVKRYPILVNTTHRYTQSTTRRTVHAICTAAGPFSAFKCHPRLDIRSPTSYTFTDASREPNATTEAGGDPRTYSSGIDAAMVLAMRRAQATMSRQDWR